MAHYASQASLKLSMVSGQFIMVRAICYGVRAIWYGIRAIRHTMPHSNNTRINIIVYNLPPGINTVHHYFNNPAIIYGRPAIIVVPAFAALQINQNAQSVIRS